jgi:predicted amidohydrolase
MKLAMIQMQTSSSLEENLKKMRAFLEQAKTGGAELAVFPEMAYFSGTKEKIPAITAQFSELKKKFEAWAKEMNLYFVPGTLREPVEGTQDRYYNTLLCIDPHGETFASYRKIFRFRANLPHHRYDESRFCEGGTEAVVCEMGGIKWGLAICFDLRFPELFRTLRKKGARAFLIPSAFTVPTGEAHWEVLLRARAIENQAFIIAPDQCLTSGENLAQYGHSLVVGPWGDPKVKLGTKEEIIFSDISSKELEECESKISVWESRNERVFPIP